MVLNLSYYSFFPIPDPAQARSSFEKRFLGQDVRGTLLLAPEGVNMNLAMKNGDYLVENVRSWLEELQCPDLNEEFKLSWSEKLTFRRFRIKVKKEIITMGIEDLPVRDLRGPHMKARDFKKILQDPDSDTLILDTRNDFEVEYGTFERAKPAGMRSFRDFPKIADELPKDKQIVMFCTGGVRCEKASAYLRKKGFDKVYQLEGGILRYLEEEGFSHFNGECFVFDDRIALNNLGMKTGTNESTGQESG